MGRFYSRACPDRHLPSAGRNFTSADLALRQFVPSFDFCPILTFF